jgi:AcrR family transcriptional regulator
MSSLVERHPELAPRLGADDTARGQRARLLAAMAGVVADKGYAAATVTDVVREAGVSRSTFYDLYASKEQCFLEAYRHGVDVLNEAVGAAVRAAALRDDDWRGQLRAGVRAYLRTLNAEPRFARTYLIEIHRAGPAALQARTEALRRFAKRYAAAATEATGDPPHPDALLILCAGTEQLCAERVRAGQHARLSELEDVFCTCAEAVLLGAHANHAKED